MKKVCILDMDGVVSRTHYSLEKELKKEYPLFSMENVLTYNFNKELGQEEMDKLGVSTDIIFKTFRNPDVFEQAELAPYFIDFLESNKDKIDFKIHSLAFCKEVGDIKEIWLEKKLGKYLKYFSDIMIEVGNNKPALENVDYIFEDSLKQLQKYYNSFPNTKLMLFNMPFNQKEYNPNFSEVLEHCTRIYSFENLLL